MRTRNGIYYDLSKSTYKCKLADTGYIFVFSSDLHLTKFEEQFKDSRIDFNLKNKARLRVPTDMKVLPDILLYRRIETRGFLVINEEGKKLCEENLILNGEKATLKS